MADKLKRCPFCGGEARMAHDFIHGWEVMCDNWKECIVHPSVVIYGDDSRDKAIEAWNNRPSPWHTGTPTKEGWYLCAYGDNFYCANYWQGGTWKNQWAGTLLAYQKIEPYRG